MGEQLSVTAGFWQPVSRYEHIRHPTVKSAASDKGWGVPGLAEAAFSRSSLEKSPGSQKGSLVYLPGVLRGSGNSSGKVFQCCGIALSLRFSLK